MPAQQLSIPLPTSVTRDTIGAFLIGVLISINLAGWLFHQIRTYYRRFWSDPRKTKAVVGFVAILNLLHIIFLSHNAYYWLISNFGNINAFAVVPFSYGCNFLILGATAGTAQLWYSVRIYRIGGKKKFLPCIIGFLAFYQFAWALQGFIVVGLIIKEQSRFQRYGPINWLVALSVNDLLIVIGMTFYLLKSRHSGWMGESQILYYFIKLTIENNALTAAIAIVDLILFLSLQNGWNIGLNVILPPLHAMSLLTLLLAREELHESGSEKSAKSCSMSQNGDFEMDDSFHSSQSTTHHRNQSAIVTSKQPEFSQISFSSYEVSQSEPAPYPTYGNY